MCALFYFRPFWFHLESVCIVKHDFRIIYPLAMNAVSSFGSLPILICHCTFDEITYSSYIRSVLLIVPCQHVMSLCPDKCLQWP